MRQTPVGLTYKMDQLISARRPDVNNQQQQQKRELAKLWAWYPGWPQNQTESEKKYLDLARELKKIMEHEGDNHDWCFWYSHQRIIKGSRGLGGRRTSGDYPNYCIIENSQNTKKSPRDLRRLAVNQTTMKDHKLKLLWNSQWIKKNKKIIIMKKEKYK